MFIGSLLRASIRDGGVCGRCVFWSECLVTAFRAPASVDMQQCCPINQYQYTAYSWLDAETIDDAVLFVVCQPARFNCPIQDGLYRLNRQAVVSDEEFEYTVGAFYWNMHKQSPLVDIDSRGVLLQMTSNSAIRHRARHLPAHTVRVPRSTSPRATRRRMSFFEND
jgi:hypothetical protein